MLQMEAVECGAAALGIVLGYYGRIVPLEELRVACGVSRDGSKASNMLAAARSYGLVAKGYKYEPEDLLSVRLPMIVFWNFSHFLVVEGFGKGKVYLNDPASGPQVISDKEFDERFTGITLVFEPGPDFVKGGVKPSTVRALASRLAGSGPALAYVLLLGIVLVFLQMVVPAFTRVFLDTYLARGLSAWLPPLLAFMAATALAMAVFTWLQQSTLLRLETKLSMVPSSTFLWHVLHLPVVFFTQRYAGELGSRVGLNDTVASLLSGQLATNTLGLLLVVLYVFLLLKYDIVLTLVAIAVAALNLAALRYIARKRKDQNQKLLQQRGQLMGTATTGLRSIETLKAGGIESDFFSRWSGYQAKAMNAEQELGVSTQVLSSIPPFLAAVNSMLILVVGGLEVMGGRLSIGTLVGFQILVASFLAPIAGLVNLGAQVQEVDGHMKRLDDVYRYPEDETAHDEAVPDRSVRTLYSSRARLSGHVELRDVTFGYSRLEPPLIEGFSMTLTPGSRVALVGGSGSGKSTVGKLIAGLYAPWAGEILFDGLPRREIPRALMTGSLAAATQEFALFDGTIAENLTMWDATLPLASAVQAAKDACIHEDISSRAGGYAHRVEEDGRNFSGGQRQRLEIARALSGNPSILILDEATSALDPVTEQMIDANIRRRGCTCLVIAHRLSTIRDCDEIIVLERGKVVQRGTHDEMLQAGGPYERLIKAGETSKLKSSLEML
jgi:NHLM bacteriocin system ABC transporter peptidase/ATP-binding protein